MQKTDIVFRNRRIGQEDIADIKRIIQSHWDRGRTFISRILCQQWQWKQPNGQLRDQVCRLLLLRLERDGYIKLPPRQKEANNECRTYYQRNQKVLKGISTEPIIIPIKQIQPIELRQVRKTTDEQLWNELINKYHYLSHNIIVGSHLKYIAFYRGRPVGCLGWGASIWALQDRDVFIGWTEKERRRNLKYVVNNTRFLILPWVEVKCLASHLLSLNIKRLSTDWIQIYGHPIYLVETFVDRSRFKGTCYKAANWIYAGQTKGYARRINFYYHGQIKDIYLYPLTPKFREKLIETSQESI